MPKFSKKSLDRLSECHPDLQRLLNVVIRYFDCKILEGHRGQETQDKYYNDGKSKLKWPESKHNKYPSLAIDVTPYPVDWKDIKRQYYFAGFVVGLAYSMGIEIRWGGDWDQDTQVKDNKFQDLNHFEIA